MGTILLVFSTRRTSTFLVSLDGIMRIVSELTCLQGDLFLHNVVAVFDIGSSEMKFAKRKAY